mgnify:CR=1 FL=1
MQVNLLHDWRRLSDRHRPRLILHLRDGFDYKRMPIPLRTLMDSTHQQQQKIHLLLQLQPSS